MRKDGVHRKSRMDLSIAQGPGPSSLNLDHSSLWAKFLQRKNLNFSTRKSDLKRFLATELENFRLTVDRKMMFYPVYTILNTDEKKNSKIKNISYKSQFFGQGLFGEIVRVPIFWTWRVCRKREIPNFLVRNRVPILGHPVYLGP